MVEQALFGKSDESHSNSNSNHKNDLGLAKLEQVKRNINDTAGHLAVLEERYSNIRKKLQLVEKNLIEHQKEAKTDLKAMRMSIIEMNHKVNEVKDKISAMASELDNVVKKEDFQVLERYMDFWEPLEFISREEAKRLIEDAKREIKKE